MGLFTTGVCGARDGTEGQAERPSLREVVPIAPIVVLAIGAGILFAAKNSGASYSSSLSSHSVLASIAATASSYSFAVVGAVLGLGRRIAAVFALERSDHDLMQ
jgi:hypothetical protein